MSSQNTASQNCPEGDPETLYFAYGSNMHLHQMANRCNDSALFAKGLLRGYKWQLNSRGGATVIRGRNTDIVEGVIFRVSPQDVVHLRHYEGVAEKRFEEKEALIELAAFARPTFAHQRTVDAARALEQQRSHSISTPPVPSGIVGIKKEKASNPEGESLANGSRHGPDEIQGGNGSGGAMSLENF